MTREAGDWWIAANLMRDAAALRNTELLPWDCWGAMPEPEDTIGSELASLFDRLAALTETPDPGVRHAEVRWLPRYISQTWQYSKATYGDAFGPWPGSSGSWPSTSRAPRTGRTRGG